MAFRLNLSGGARKIGRKLGKRSGWESEDIAVLFAGSGWERKGLRFAVEAVDRQDTRSEPARGRARRETKIFFARVQFLGVVREMPSLYHAADIFLLPTIYDPFSNACLEALAAGLPVITTRANGFSEIIENGRHGTILDDRRMSTRSARRCNFGPIPQARPGSDR